jgi:branched-chain amino acid transport system substrate-binding protein
VLTNKACTPVSLHWTYDTYAMPAALAKAIVEQGGRGWYFLTIDYAFGHALEAQAARFVLAGGGHMLGDTPHPPGETDFAGSLTKAAQSGATVLGLATSGAPMMNALKQFQEFGVNKTMRPAALLTNITDMHALGLPATQGLLFVAAFHWDQNDETRAFAKRFRKTDEAGAVMAKMRATPINDFMTKNGRIREDGRVIRDLYLLQVKTPAELHGKWDIAKVIATIPGEQAFRPLSESECPLVQR